MDAHEDTTTQEPEPTSEAPSTRARALRDEIFGAALSLDEAAYILGLDRTTVAKYLRERTLLGFQIGREWLVPEHELRAYVKRMTELQLKPQETPQRRENPKARTFRTLVERLTPPHRPAMDINERLERLTTRARTALLQAEQEARRLNHPCIGTEHLLLGLLAEGQGVAAVALRALGADLDRLRTAVETIMGRGAGEQPEELGLTPRAKKVIELAVDEARQLGHRFIGTEHLLLGLVREGEGIAAGALEEIGLGLAQVREETLRVLAGTRPASTREREAPPIPAEAATLLSGDEAVTVCARCAARSPGYFRHCFNCGAPLVEG